MRTSLVLGFALLPVRSTDAILGMENGQVYMDLSLFLEFVQSDPQYLSKVSKDVKSFLVGLERGEIHENPS